MIWLSDNIEFPSHKSATKDGIIALGGDLSTKRLIYAYKNGIFPWFSEDEPIVWYSPPERMVLFPKDLKIAKSMRKQIQKNKFIITENKAFKEVIYNCKNIMMFINSIKVMYFAHIFRKIQISCMLMYFIIVYSSLHLFS